MEKLKIKTIGSLMWSKSAYIKATLLISFVIIRASFLFSQDNSDLATVKKGNYFISNYGPLDYKGHIQIWSLCTDNDGNLYVGNSDNVIQYDGKDFRQIRIENATSIRSLAKDDEGTIFIGTNSDFGYLKATDHGELKFVSLLNLCDSLWMPTGEIWRIHATKKHGIIFQSFSSVFSYKDGKIKRIANQESGYFLTYLINDELYIQHRAKGLLKFDGNTFKEIEGGKQFFKKVITAILPMKDKNWFLVATQKTGLFKTNFKSYIKNNDTLIAEPFLTNCDNLISECSIYKGIDYSENCWALATSNQGLLLLNKSGELISHITTNNGLQNNNILSLTIDKQKNIWLGLDRGLTKIEAGSPLTKIVSANKDEGVIECVSKINNIIVAGGGNGVYKFITDSYLPSGKLIPIKGIDKRTWQLQTIGSLPKQQCLAATSAGVYLIEPSIIGDDKVSLIVDCDARVIASSHKNDNTYFIGTEKGIFTIEQKLNGDWQLTNLSDEVNDNLTSVVELENSEIWVGTKSNGVVKLTPLNNEGYSLTFYNTENGLPSNFTNKPVLINNQLFFITNDGFYVFDKNMKIPFWKESELNSILGKNKQISKLTQYDDELWLQVLNKQNQQYYILSMNLKTKKVLEQPFSRLPDVLFYSFYKDQKQNLMYLGGDAGLFVADLQNNKVFNTPYKSVIRTVLAADSTIIYQGNKSFLKDSTQLKYFNLPFSQNNLLFTFSAPFFEGEELLEFRYFLEGNDKAWSEWSTKTEKEFTNLAPGKYTFKVQAINIYGQRASIDSYSFNILPPWYRTLWAYLGYTIIAIALVYAIVQLSVYRLTQAKNRLEGVVNQRTAEVVKQKEEIEHQKEFIEEKHKEITDSINYAERIQRSFLATAELLDANLQEYFVFFQPKDIVSGDFYWAAKLTNGNFALVTADSTGHGVPGAIMSILNISSLENAVEQGALEPSDILNKTREKIITRLKKDGSKEGGKDGMDASLISFDFIQQKLTYAAANNPIWVVRENTMIELKADKMPIGKHDKDHVPFTKHDFMFNKGDVVYAITDGMPDQFGGPQGKKFMYKNLKEMLIEINHQPMLKQKELLNLAFNKWKGNLEQVDDVCVIGVRV